MTDIRVTINQNTGSRIAVQPAIAPTSVRAIQGGGGSGGDFDPSPVYAHTNLVFGVTNAAFGVANTANLRGNLAQMSSNAAYDAVNSLTSVVQITFGVANTGNLYANLAFRAANAAFDFANTINIKVDSAYGVANVANTRANLAQLASNAAYDFANNINIKTDAAFGVANNANLYANLAFRAANAAYDFANTINIKTDAAFGVANVANLRGNLAQMASNAAYDFANTINIKVDSAYAVANVANARGNLAQMASNAAYDQANIANLMPVGNTMSNGYFAVRSTRHRLNFIPASANVRINVDDDSAGDRINVTIESMGSGGGSGTGANLTAGNTLANGFYFTRTTPLANINFIDDALTKWNVDVDSTNFRINVHSVASRAPFDTANTANLYANLAFRAANAAYDFANAINSKVDYVLPVANAAFSVANNANVYANLAFRAANAAYDFANTININVAATMLVANNANARANLAQMASNAAYDFANTINIKTDAVVYVANLAYDFANVINSIARSAYNKANTTGVLSIANTLQANSYVATRSTGRSTLNFVPGTDIVVEITDDVTGDRSNIKIISTATAGVSAGFVYDATNAAFFTANTANQEANLAFMAANAAFLLANNKYDKAGGPVTGNVAIRQPRIISDNIAFDLTADWANTAQTFTLLRANIANTLNANSNSAFLDFQANGVSLLRVTANGVVYGGEGNFNTRVIAGTLNVEPAILGAFAVANNANLYANLAFRAANAAYDFANVININVAATMLVANNANVYANLAFRAANAAYDFANTININVAATMLVANNANVYANLAFRAANAAYDFANAINSKADYVLPVANTANARANLAQMASNAAYDFANVINTIARSAFTQANASNLVIVGNTMSNGYYATRATRTRLNFIPASANVRINVDDDSAGDRINVTIEAISGSGTGGTGTGANLTAANTLANGYSFVRTLPYANINFIGDTLTDFDVTDDSTHYQINVKVRSSSAPFAQANAPVYVSISAPASPVANSLWWNSENAVLSIYYSDGTSSQWIDVSGGGLTQIGGAGSFTLKAANTFSNAYVLISSTGRSTINFIPGSDDVKVTVADDSSGDRANVTIDVPGVGLAFTKANTANSTALAAFITANTGNLYANLAFRAANAVYDFANTININVAATMLVANNANVYANLAFRAANAAYDFANVINTIARSAFAQANAPVYVSDTSPGSPVANSLWYKSDTGAMFIRYNDGSSSQWIEVGALGDGQQPTQEVLSFALSDETSPLIAGTNKLTFYFAKKFVCQSVYGALSANSSSGNTHVDVNKNGTSIFSTNITIMAANAHSRFGGSQPTLSSTTITFEQDDKMNVDIDLAGTNAAGLKVHLFGYYTD